MSGKADRADAPQRIFINYRRDDTLATATWLERELKRRIVHGTVFLDHRGIDAGSPWPDRLREELGAATVVLALIGPRWLTQHDDDGMRRIDDPEDWVRCELEVALASRRVVIPVLVDDAKAISERAVRTIPGLARLPHCQAVPLRSLSWEGDGAALHAQLAKHGFEFGPADASSKPPTDPEATDFDGAITSYLAKAESEHATIPIVGFQTKLRVAIDLAELYVPLRAMVDLRGDGDADFANADDAEAKVREFGRELEIDLIGAFDEAAKRHARGVVILGDPGSGKTTHLKRLLLKCIRDGSDSLGLDSGTVPVFLPLRALRDLSHGLDAFIEAQLQSPHLATPAGFGRSLLARGRVLFLLDGLDEVADPEQRVLVARWIEDAVLAHPTCHFVVTCRFAGYRTAARLSERFLEMHLRPLTAEQASTFVHNWYRIVETGLASDPAQGRTLGAAKAEELLERLRQPDFRARSLSGN